MALVRNINEQEHLIKCMRDIVLSMNHEGAYDSFIWTFPDEADDDEIRELAEDAESFDEIADAFFRVCKTYGKHGFCTTEATKD